MIKNKNKKLKNIFSGAIFIIGFFCLDNNSFAATEVVRTVKPSGQGGDYTTMAAWEAGEQRDLTAMDEIAVAEISGTWSTPDTTAVTIDGWTTDATRYIKIYTTAEARHPGKWDEGKYRRESNNDNAIVINEDYVRFDGLQLKITAADNNSNRALNISSVTSDANEIWISNCIIRGVLSGTSNANYGILTSANSYVIKIWNNIVYDWGKTSPDNNAGIFLQGSTSYVYNNTLYGNDDGLRNEGGGEAIAKNNIVTHTGNVNNIYIGTFAAGTDYNATDGTDDIGQGSNNRISQTFSFASEANDDFHLASTDTGARESGADLSADADLPVTTDIDGHSRPTLTAFDIGADEATTPIFYSVGQNTTDHKTGSPTVTIASGVGTFSVAQTASNMGVGDKVTYNTSTVAYISQKISTTQWKLITATGGVPADITDSAVVSIAHAFASLSAAEAGAPGASYLNTTDLVAGNFQLNFPCYYDTGADTTAVTIDGWTTSPPNYIKIYTPNNTTTEVNVSQRHSGVWDTTKYRIEHNGDDSVIALYDEYVHIDGLQLKKISTGAQWPKGIRIGINSLNSDVKISNNIIRADLTGLTNNGGGIAYTYNSSSKVEIWNNVIYDWIGGAGGIDFGIAAQTGVGNYKTYYVYNNTIYNCEWGINQNGATTLISKNNVVYNNGTDYSGTFDSASTNNLSKDATAPAFGTYYRNATVAFADESNDDFHLSPADTGARELGADLSDDAYLSFQNDIDGEHRGGDPDGSPWDIGADEYVGTTVNAPDLPGGSQIKINMSLTDKMTDGLVGMWSFDGANMDWSQATAEARDTSGNNNHGDVSGAVAGVGKRGQALDFDGTDNVIVSDSNNSLDAPSAVTISAWYRPDNMNAGYYVLASKDGSGSSNYWLGRNTGQFGVTFYNLGWHNHWTVNSYTAGQWYHVVGIIDSANDNVRLYVNGALDVATQAEDHDMIVNNDSVYIGKDNGNGTTIDGLLDEVRIYDRALSVDEVGDLYRLGQAKIRR